MDVGTVEPALDQGQLVVHVADLEVAPEGMVLALVQLDEELAQGRRRLLDGAVVAEGRVVVVGIDAPEERVRRLVEEVAEEVLDRPLARVGARRQLPVLAELAVHVERQPAIRPRVGVEGSVLTREASAGPLVRFHARVRSAIPT